MTGLLSGKVAIVTGSAGDVGKTIVTQMLAEGASVVATDFDDGKLGELFAGDSQVATLKHDVASAQGWQVVVDTAVARFGKIDILVNCAGITPVCPLENIDLDHWNRVFAINSTGPMLGMQAALPELKKSAASNPAGAAIVNIASAQGMVAGQPGLCAYTASKGAVRLLTRTAAVEFGRLGYNIRCNVVAPSALGGTALMTGQLKQQVDRGTFADLDAALKTISAAFPLGRMARPIDVAEAVIFLASDRAAAITGMDMPVDCGRLA